MGSLPANAGATVVVIDPNEPERVSAADDTAFYRSDDAGQTWVGASQGLPDDGIAALALDPRQPRRLYAAMADGSLYVSEDGGAAWSLAAEARDAAG